jgi:hypothetical protein
MGPQVNIKELHAFLREVVNKPFAWGAWDCLIFTNEAFRRMHGRGWADDWVGRYMDGGKPITTAQLRREYGYQTIDDALSDRLEQAYNVPPRGALVVGGASALDTRYMGVGFGVSVGSNAAFLSERGVIYLPIEEIDSAWVMKNDTA